MEEPKRILRSQPRPLAATRSAPSNATANPTPVPDTSNPLHTAIVAPVPTTHTPTWEHERVYGSQVVDRSEESENVVARIKHAVAWAKQDRRDAKRRIAEQVYAQRATFRRTAKAEEIADHPGGPEFLAMFGVGGTHDVQASQTQITSHSIMSRINDLGIADLEMRDGPQNQTHVYHRDRHVLTLHRGATAFKPAGQAASGRALARKHGSKKPYVLDDQGVPTRRFAYAIKDSDQIGILRRGETLHGRFISKAGNTSVMHATPREQAEVLGRRQNEIQYPHGYHTIDDMAFTHQEYGTGDRQRGASVASTARPLLSNEGRGFARIDDPGALKLTLDLAAIPPMKQGQHAQPNLLNLYHRIPGFEDRRFKAKAIWNVKGAVNKPPVGQPVSGGNLRAEGVRYPQAEGDERSAWTVGKNRELFVRKLKNAYVAANTKPSALERTNYSAGDIGPLLAGAKDPAPRHTDAGVLNDAEQQKIWERIFPAQQHKQFGSPGPRTGGQ